MTTLEEIRQLYYGATKATIVRDFDRAIDLLKTMVSEEERERATVYMQGMAEMRKQWAPKPGQKAQRDQSK
jgi:hypothetical protein